MTFMNWSTFLEKNNKHCVVYGAGAIAKLFASFLLEDKKNDYKIDFFAVSFPKEAGELLNIPVKFLKTGDVPSNTPFIVAAREEGIPSILTYLYKLGYYNICVLSKEEWVNMIPNTNHLVAELVQELQGVEKVRRRKDGEYISTFRDRRGFAPQFRMKIRDDQAWCKEREALISGLDEASTHTVYQIIGRLYKLIFCQEIEYTDEEKAECRKIADRLKKNTFQLSKNHFVYENYHLPVNQFESTVFYYKHGLLELSRPDYFKEKDIIDAGGFVGDSALVLSKYTTGKVHTFEAEEENYKKIQTTMAMNDNKQIVPVNSALTNKVGTVEFLVLGETSGANKVAHGGKNSKLNVVSVPCTTIDAYVKENQIQVGLIKTDVEGAEQALLEGAIETLKTQKPTLSISIYHSLNDFF